MPANAAAVPIEFMTSALGQVIAHCKAHFHGFDLESIDHAPLGMSPPTIPFWLSFPHSLPSGPRLFR